ncbi:MAG: hypothetical protein P8165_12485 [Deltaproteobacteria bacterium]
MSGVRFQEEDRPGLCRDEGMERADMADYFCVKTNQGAYDIEARVMRIGEDLLVASVKGECHGFGFLQGGSQRG